MEEIRPLTVVLTHFFMALPADKQAALIAKHPEHAAELRKVIEAIERGEA
jgi:hypothetical protein